MRNVDGAGGKLSVTSARASRVVGKTRWVQSLPNLAWRKEDKGEGWRCWRHQPGIVLKTTTAWAKFGGARHPHFKVNERETVSEGGRWAGGVRGDGGGEGRGAEESGCCLFMFSSSM